MLTPSQLVAARGLLRWSIVDLAAASGTSRFTIVSFESRGSEPRLGTVQAWIAALHRAGVILQDEDEAAGPGVRLRKGVTFPVPVQEPPNTKPRARGRKA